MIRGVIRGLHPSSPRSRTISRLAANTWLSEHTQGKQLNARFRKHSRSNNLQAVSPSSLAAQTSSIFIPYQQPPALQAQQGGVHSESPISGKGRLGFSRDFSISSSCLHRRVFLHTSIHNAMSTLSQPQTPAALDSPLREHRHRPVERLTDHFETPSIDDRKYRLVRLPNQLEVLLVHDVETDKASAAMDVNVGNFCDPPDLPGLAHCLEHMLFMGTTKV